MSLSNSQGSKIIFKDTTTNNLITVQVTNGVVTGVTTTPDDGSVTNAKIANNAVDDSKISGVSGSKLAAASVADSKIISVDSTKLFNAISDAVHGNRSGGSLHSDASGGSSGFMSASDFSKLSGITAGAKKVAAVVASVSGTIGAGANTNFDSSVSLASFDSDMLVYAIAMQQSWGYFVPGAGSNDNVNTFILHNGSPVKTVSGGAQSATYAVRLNLASAASTASLSGFAGAIFIGIK